jgi:hypothetical protein
VPRAAVQPIRGGTAPGNAPTSVDNVVAFSKVCKRRRTRDHCQSEQRAQWIDEHEQVDLREDRDACAEGERPPTARVCLKGSDDFAVRRIRPSRSRSAYWLSVAIPKDKRRCRRALGTLRHSRFAARDASAKPAADVSTSQKRDARLGQLA